MIELKDDGLEFTFPEVHAKARLRIEFQRTLRIPDDSRSYSLPPGLGCFPLRHVDDFSRRVPDSWRAHGGVMLPMFQSEAMWLNFSSPLDFPFAIKVAAGKIDAVTGEGWNPALNQNPQDYLSVPEQPWLDGFAVERGVVRQFVAMPLGAGYTTEEQITGEAEYGGLQLLVYPMKGEVFDRMQPDPRELFLCEVVAGSTYVGEMGLAPGGRMNQEIYADPYEVTDWDQNHSSRCFVHLANSLVWRSITGEDPPTVPPTAEAYTSAGFPWFDWYDERPALSGSEKLRNVKSVKQMGEAKGDVPLPENASVQPTNVVSLGQPRPNQVREGIF